MKIARRIVRCAALAAMIAAAAVCCAVYIATDPDFGGASVSMSPTEKLMQTRTITDGEGRELFKVNGFGRLSADVGELSEHTLDAFIAVEDARFFKHDGFDVKRIVAAALKDVAAMRAKEGASTITQQLAKNLWLRPEKTLSRKIDELRIARRLERVYSKKQILGMYLDTLYFGGGVYGIENAARRFFGVSASDLDIGQSALLAGVINNPSRFDPYRCGERAEARKRLVLLQMRKQGYINADEQRIFSSPTPLSRQIVNGSIFASYASECGCVTAYSPEVQSAAESAIAMCGGDHYLSVVVIDARTERLVAAAANTFEDISRSRRQAGSIVKPILCYAPALEENIITPVTPLLDKPTNFGGYSPRNYKGLYYGWVTATESLCRSLNVPAVRLLDMVGVERSKAYAERFGLEYSASDRGLSLALGASSRGATLLSLAKAYCNFARCDGKAVGRETAYLINHMLRKCAETGTAKALAGTGAAAKTGTVGSASGDTDAYCIAYNPKYVVAVWAGAKDGVLPDGVTGGGLPAETCARILKNSALEGGAFVRPDTVVDVEIDGAELGEYHRIVRAGAYTPQRDRINAPFSVYNMPETRIAGDMRSGDYDNFRIVDGFVD